MIYIDGKYEYIEFRDRNGKLHRNDGPALINVEYQAWYQHGLFHRNDGPAFINVEYQAWYIEGVKYTESEYHDKLKEMGLE